MKSVIILSLSALFAVGCSQMPNPPLQTVDAVTDVSTPILVDRSDEAELFILDMVAQSLVDNDEDLGKIAGATIECSPNGLSSDGQEFNYECDAAFPQFGIKAKFVCKDVVCELESYHEYADF